MNVCDCYPNHPIRSHCPYDLTTRKSSISYPRVIQRGSFSWTGTVCGTCFAGFVRRPSSTWLLCSHSTDPDPWGLTLTMSSLTVQTVTLEWSIHIPNSSLLWQMHYRRLMDLLYTKSRYWRFSA